MAYDDLTGGARGVQRHRVHRARPAAVVLSALLAVLTFFLPMSAKSAPVSRPSSTGTATAAPATAQASSAVDAQRPVTGAHPVLGRAHADVVPYPVHGFLGPGAGDVAPHRAVGGPAVAVAGEVPGAGRGGQAYRPRGPPSRWSTGTEVRIDA